MSHDRKPLALAIGMSLAGVRVPAEDSPRMALIKIANKATRAVLWTQARPQWALLSAPHLPWSFAPIPPSVRLP